MWECSFFRWIFILSLWAVSSVSSEIGANTTDSGPTKDSGARQRDSDYYRLEKTLLTNYKTHLLPVYSHSTTINITVRLLMYALHEVSESYQTTRHFNWLGLQWKDEFLVWDPDRFNGIDTLELPGGTVWIPNIVFSNSVTETKLSNVYAVVSSGGRVTWGPVGMQETMCTMDVTFYPFDVQRCGIAIDMWTISEHQVRLECVSAQKDVAYMENSEWELSDLSMESRAVRYDQKPYSRCYVSFLIKRRRLFHCLTLMVPNALLAVLTSFVFVLPVQCGEKLSYSMSLLLAFAVNLSVLVSTMPHSSLHVSYLMVYLTCLSIVTALSVITTACMQKLYHKNETVSPKITIVILFLAKLLDLAPDTRHGISPDRKSSHQNEGSCKIVHIRTELMNSNTVDVSEGLISNYNNGQNQQGRKINSENVPQRATENHLPAISAKRMSSRESDHLRRGLQWGEAVVILDYVFFGVFFFVIVAMTSALIVTLFIGQ